MAQSQESGICNMKSKFIKWMDSNMKHNSSLLTMGQYDNIRNIFESK